MASAVGTVEGARLHSGCRSYGFRADAPWVGAGRAEFVSGRNHANIRQRRGAQSVIPAKCGKKTCRVHGVRAEIPAPAQKPRRVNFARCSHLKQWVLYSSAVSWFRRPFLSNRQFFATVEPHRAPDNNKSPRPQRRPSALLQKPTIREVLTVAPALELNFACMREWNFLGKTPRPDHTFGQGRQSDAPEGRRE
jgi:hypothetical protein